MTPAPPASSGSASGNPTVKQQRAAQRAAKLEEYHRQKKRSARNRRIGLIGGIVAAVAVIDLLVTSIVLTPQSATYTAGGGDGTIVEGVETFENTSLHVETPVDYPQTPPAGGEHHPTWLNCGVYTEPVPNENAVHSLEHGALWVTYDPSLSDADLDTLTEVLPSTYVILSPFDGLPSPIVVSGWNVQLQVDSADDERIEQFFEQHWRSNDVPEPGALCTGAFDAPGKA